MWLCSSARVSLLWAAACFEAIWPDEDQMCWAAKLPEEMSVICVALGRIPTSVSFLPWWKGSSLGTPGLFEVPVISGLAAQKWMCWMSKYYSSSIVLHKTAGRFFGCVEQQQQKRQKKKKEQPDCVWLESILSGASSSLLHLNLKYLKATVCYIDALILCPRANMQMSGVSSYFLPLLRPFSPGRWSSSLTGPESILGLTMSWRRDWRNSPCWPLRTTTVRRQTHTLPHTVFTYLLSCSRVNLPFCFSLSQCSCCISRGIFNEASGVLKLVMPATVISNPTDSKSAGRIVKSPTKTVKVGQK